MNAGERSWAQDVVGGWRQRLSCASDNKAAVVFKPLLGTAIDVFGCGEELNQGHQNGYHYQLVAVEGALFFQLMLVFSQEGHSLGSQFEPHLRRKVWERQPLFHQYKKTQNLFYVLPLYPFLKIIDPYGRVVPGIR